MYDSEFVRFETACPNCGSSRTPAFARYSDGHGWCFSCGYREAGTYQGPNPNKGVVISIESARGGPTRVRPIPEEAKPFLGAPALVWLKKYGITAKEVSNHSLLWWDERKWLIFPYYSTPDHLAGWQARNFDPKFPDQKWMTYGQIKERMHLIAADASNLGEVVVLVEDIVSAIKVGRHITCMPLFGAHIALPGILRLARTFSGVGLWLDSDKEFEARLYASRASQYLETTCVIKTELDPKEYNDEQIRDQLRLAGLRL